MLSALVEGKEASQIILIQDCVGQLGRALLKCFTVYAAKRFDRVCLFSLDFHPSLWLQGLDKETTAKIRAFDGYSNILPWIPNNEKSYPVMSLSDSLDVCQLLESSYTDETREKPAVVVIDSLSPLITQSSTSFTCHTLQSLLQCKQNGCSVVQVICLVHADLHNDSDVVALQYMSSTIISHKDLEERSIDSESGFSGRCEVTHKRKSGKVVKTVENYIIDKVWNLSSTEGQSQQQTPALEDTTSIQFDPAANLTFNVRLSNSERVARSHLVLPYTYTDSEKAAQLSGVADQGGKIFYEPDDTDDIDEEDPDDDLDI